MPIRTALLLLSAAAISGCGGKHVTISTAPEIERYAHEPVLLAPFRTPATGEGSLRSKEVMGDGPELMDKRLRQKLLDMDVEIRVPSGEVPKTGPLSSQAVQLGRAYHVPAVLFGTLSAYVEREGSPAGIRRPASVGFSLVLMETEKGLTLWEARFDETQRALFDDLSEIRSFWKRRGRWLAADELAEFGLEELLKASPWFGKSGKPEKSGAADENLPGH